MIEAAATERCMLSAFVLKNVFLYDIPSGKMLKINAGLCELVNQNRFRFNAVHFSQQIEIA